MDASQVTGRPQAPQPNLDIYIARLHYNLYIVHLSSLGLALSTLLVEHMITYLRAVTESPLSPVRQMSKLVSNQVSCYGYRYVKL